MDIPVNAKAEGRVLVAWEHIRYPNLTSQDSSGMCLSLCVRFIHHVTCAGGVTALLDGFTPDWRGQGSVWDAYRRTCPPDTPARQLYSSYRDSNVQKKVAVWEQSRGLGDHFNFVETVPDSVDFCENPWAHYTQGHFFSDWRTVPVLYPLFSPAKPDGFADIRIPSHYYHRGSHKYTYGWDPKSRKVKDIDDMEVPWEQKSDLIFWRGSTTGGGNTPPGFAATYQRHRYVSFLVY